MASDASNAARGGGERGGTRLTPSGLPLDPAYTGGGTQERPGEFPFTRGIHAGMHRDRLWTFRQYSGFGNPHQTNERLRYLVAQGQTGLSVAFDLPTQIGYDSDHPLARGEVGRVGVPISTLDDVDDLFAAIPLAEASVSMTINSTAAALLAFVVALARRRRVPLAQLRGTVQNDILKEFTARRTYRFPLVASMRLVTDVFEYCLRELPHWNPISISGYHVREAGCNAIQEVGLTLANAIAYLDAASARGLEVAQIAPRLSFFWSAHNHLFEEVAKFRAARRLWARTLRGRFGVPEPDAARMRFHVQTAGSTLTFQEPENNAVRVTVQALAAVLGGTQSLHTNGVDEALGLPSRLAVRTALRTQQILAHESGVADVADPLGGSPLIEDLTDRVEAGAIQLIAEIDAAGGAVAAIEQGLPQSMIEEEAYRHQREVESGRRVVVGVNCLREEGPAESAVRIERVEPALEAARIEALCRWKAARDGAGIAESRRQLERAARNGTNIVEALVPCAERGVTLGEMAETLAEVFGEYRSEHA